jgi:hypothetical protein
VACPDGASDDGSRRTLTLRRPSNILPGQSTPAGRAKFPLGSPTRHRDQSEHRCACPGSGVLRTCADDSTAIVAETIDAVGHWPALFP